MDSGLEHVEHLLLRLYNTFLYPRTNDGENNNSSSLKDKEPLTIEQQLNGEGSDVKDILDTFRKEIFKKCHIVFDEGVDESVIKAAVRFGAVHQTSIDGPRKATHAIAEYESPLALEAKSKSIWVPHHHWIQLSCQAFRRIQEQKFSVFNVYGINTRSASAKESHQDSALTLPPSISPQSGDESRSIDDQ